ncbi:MAG: dihydrofolate reductase family protein [Gemmatimonadaceae bacterium]|nr:dihydrofolate reductase family protein [Chitinophagaceae bacterium]
MRKIMYGINLTADGCCDHTKGNATEDIHQFFTDLMSDVDLMVYGRKTYELMVPYWPDVAKNETGTKQDIEFAKRFDAIDKVVFSRSLEKVGGNSKIIRNNLEEAILEMKQQPGKNISIGGVDLPTQLVALGLVDEFFFVVHPVIAGEGRRLFDNLGMKDKLNLQLVYSKVLPSKAVVLHYLKG